MKTPSRPKRPAGKLRIGDDWNAITIIALSQNNPLKAVAEFVENSIDARAKHITIIRGKEKGAHFLKIKDDGEGVPRDEAGIPNFQYVATHICDSIKRRLKARGADGLQGEFGIGLLSFWTVGEHLTLSSAGADQRVYQMHMSKGDASYRIIQRHVLLPELGTELAIRNILPGIRNLSGEKIQWYLASELRDRIRHSGAQIRVIDRTARAEYQVEPRQFEGRLLHEIEKALPKGSELYLELYLTRHDSQNAIGLYRSGTRVLDQITVLPIFQETPWTSGYLQGIIDAPYLHLTPGTRTGLIYDETLTRLANELAPVESLLARIIEEQQRAEEEQASRDVLKSIQKALKEALLALPAEEYDWFNLAGVGKTVRRPGGSGDITEDALILQDAVATQDARQKQFFEYAGPLFSVRISPASTLVPVGGSKTFRAIPRDRVHHLVEQGVSFSWEIVEGNGRLDPSDSEISTFRAGNEPSLVRIRVSAKQGDIVCSGEALITVTDTLLPPARTGEAGRRGIPSYTFDKAPGELWRSRYDGGQNVIVINNGHRDFVFASRSRALKLRYICRLFAKELVLKNFSGMPSDQLLERIIELSLYAEEHLK